MSGFDYWKERYNNDIVDDDYVGFDFITMIVYNKTNCKLRSHNQIIVQVFLKRTHRPSSDELPLHRLISSSTLWPPIQCSSGQFNGDLTAGWRQLPAALQRWVGNPIASVPELPPFDRGQQLVSLSHLCSQEASLLSHLIWNPPIVPGPDKEGECSDKHSAAEAMDSLS